MGIGGLRELLRGLREQRARTFTTLLGLTWGTFSVVVLLAFGSGLESRMQETANNMGSGIAVVWPGRTTRSWAGLPRGRPVRVLARDVLALPLQVPELDLVSPEYIRKERIRVGSRIHRVTLSGVYPAYGELRAWSLREGGRFVNDRDIRERRRVVVLGNLIKEGLFGAREALGRTVVIQGRPFTVVGVLHPKKQDSYYAGGPDENRVCLPATTCENVFGHRYVDTFIYRSRDSSVQARATDGVYEGLARICRFDPKDRQALYVWDTVEEARVRFYAFLGFDLILAGAGALTLLVGAVGVGNLMFIRVRQRTKEIGIQMALGARPRRILFSVLGESLVLVALGGLLGFILAWLITAGIALTPLVEDIGTPRISAPIAVGTVLLLGFVGLLAGYFPARRAAKLDPVRALAD